MQGEGNRFSVWISLLIAGKHDGGYSMEGDGLRAEGELFVLFGLYQEQLERRVLETALFSYLALAQILKGGKYLCCVLIKTSSLSPW